MPNKDIYNTDWKIILEGDENIYNTSTWVVRIKSWLRTVIKLFNRLPDIKNNTSDADYLFVKSLLRDDYDKLFKQITSCCPQERMIKLDVHGIAVKRNSYRLSFYSFRVLFNNFYLFIKVINWNIPKSIFIITNMLWYMTVFEYINNNIKYKNLIVFADMQAIDNLLVQAAKQKGITTVTLQHGLYIDYTKMENINSINYRNQISDYFLAWGNSTKELINKFNPETRVVVCGKPMEFQEISLQKSDYFTLLFDQELLKKYNQKLLQIAYELQKKTKLKINIRFHPKNNEADYEIMKSNTYINKELEFSVFILAHTTSMIHELLRMGIPVFKMRSDVPALSVPEMLMFSTADDLELALQHDDLLFHDYVEDGKEYIEFIGNDSLGKYREFFNRLPVDKLKKVA